MLDSYNPELERCGNETMSFLYMYIGTSDLNKCFNTSPETAITVLKKKNLLSKKSRVQSGVLRFMFDFNDPHAPSLAVSKGCS